MNRTQGHWETPGRDLGGYTVCPELTASAGKQLARSGTETVLSVLVTAAAVELKCSINKLG